MPNDLITLNNLANELNNILAGGKIDKITEPEKDEIFLNIRNKTNNYLLVLSANPNNPRIHITKTKKINPLTAYNFCMHLRKYMLGATINSIKIFNGDRIVGINCTCKNDLRDVKQYTLYLELINRYSNMILVDENHIISTVLKPIPIDTRQARTLIGGVKYKPVPNTSGRKDIFDSIGVRDILEQFKGQDTLEQYLCANVNGASYSTAKKIFDIANVDINIRELSNVQIQAILDSINTMKDIIQTPLYQPCISTNGKKMECFVTPYEDIEYTYFPTINQSMDHIYSISDTATRIKDKTKNLESSLKNFLTKTKKKIKLNTDKLAECDNMNAYKEFGELIISNIHNITKGDKIATVNNFFDADYTLIDVPLKITHSPDENAQLYFKKYNKLKRAQLIVTEQLKINKIALEYAEAIQYELSRIKLTDSLDDIENEMIVIGAMKPKKLIKGKKVKKAPPSKPMIYEIGDYSILVGRNNIMNDKLTFKVANAGDIWLHASKIHGAHSIIIANTTEPIPDNILQIALEITAYHSSARESTKVTVDYTERRNVRRISGANAGMVNYSDYSSATVIPNEHLEYIYTD